MNKLGPIIVVEDDEDDIEFMKDVFINLNFNNKIIFLKDGKSALNYLKDEEIQPFIIICDMNMPVMNGISLKKEIQKSIHLRLKCVPFLFLTTSANHQDVIDAYSNLCQGFFVKPSSIVELKDIIKKIVEYWQYCKSPDYS